MFSKALTAVALLVTALAVGVSASPLELKARQTCTATYTVVPGDTCFAIATENGITVATLEALNPSINSGCTNIFIGEVLCVSE
ncbi:hypothetical protein C8R45DRAFT_202508 [Mycena sanguinolenta]|nr:hypothetical protein C8R45DRAFT_202508 [Mycena sanguinolenta]